jgi:hypothetical protein
VKWSSIKEIKEKIELAEGFALGQIIFWIVSLFVIFLFDDTGVPIGCGFLPFYLTLLIIFYIELRRLKK